MFSCPVVNMKTLATTTEIRKGTELSAKSHDSPERFTHPCASRPQSEPAKSSDTMTDASILDVCRRNFFFGKLYHSGPEKRVLYCSHITNESHSKTKDKM